MSTEMRLGRVSQASPLRVRLNGDIADAPAVGPAGLALDAEVTVVTLEGRRFAIPAVPVALNAPALVGVDGRGSVETVTAASAFGGNSFKAPRFHTGVEIGLPGGFYAVITVAPWGDDSGGGVHQLAFGNAGLAGNSSSGTTQTGGDLWHRYGTRAAGWNSWRRIDGGDNGWHDIGTANQPAFTNSWTNWASGLQTAAYRKDGQGFVHLKGVVQGGAANTSVFTLPVGYRPWQTQVAATMDSTNTLTRLDIQWDTGAVIPNRTGVASWLSLEVKPFYAER